MRMLVGSCSLLEIITVMLTIPWTHEAVRFHYLISTHGLTQHITSATYVQGHILDLVLT